ncbi:MAG: hypothetical protein JOZ42_01565 [Acetobacteraceae bacterium]|nr:hypothetical protein [Acetobacteraceae bacterium]
MPRSDAARAAGEDRLATCLTGGDDYELLLAVPAARTGALQAASGASGVPVTRIGAFRRGPPELRVTLDGADMKLTQTGWSHF